MEHTACLGVSYKITIMGWTKHVIIQLLLI